VGARLGYYFIHNGFGMAAFALLPYLALSGLFLLFGYRPFSLLRIAIHTILFTAWFSLTLGFIFHPWFPLMGGTFGYFGIAKLNQMIGWPGSLIFLISYPKRPKWKKFRKQKTIQGLKLLKTTRMK
jgi:S-DNA-T family DNA segregation ATPase FtsK/SpoIIIE